MKAEILRDPLIRTPFGDYAYVVKVGGNVVMTTIFKDEAEYCAQMINSNLPHKEVEHFHREDK